MKIKHPVQILLVDDNGNEIFNGYVTPGGESYYSLNPSDPDGLLDAMRGAIKQPIEKGAAKWFCH